MDHTGASTRYGEKRPIGSRAYTGVMMSAYLRKLEHCILCEWRCGVERLALPA